MKRKNTISLLKVCFSFTLGLLAFKDAEGACAWPAVFQSSAWRDSGKGDIFFDISSMTGWSIFTVDTSTTVQEWECLSASTFDTDGRLIMITASSFQLFGNTNYYAYLCITLTKITDYSYRYYINHDIVSVFHDQRLFIYTVDTLSDVGTICSDASGAMGSEYQVWVKGNSESLAKIDCPWSFLGRYRYEHTTYDNVQSCDITTSEVSTCSNTMEMQFDYTACATKVAYSNSDTVWCVANVVASGNNYVTVYNGNDADSDIDDINTYRFTCFAIFDNASQASVSPRHCQRDQTPNHIPITNSDDEIGALVQFSPAIETCPTCPELVDPDRGNVAIETMDTSTTATYTCDSPYSLVGVSLRTCQTNGTWTGSAPYCGCASPPSLSNGALSINNDGTIATYTCDMGYTIDGLSTRNCQISTAMWEGNDPTCVECEAIPTLSGRSYSFSRTSSGTVTVVTFTCLSGYTLSGTSSLTCQSDGTWSDSLPLCAACEVLTNPQSGFVVISSANSISTAAYTCSTGYSLIGDQTRTCQADGTWDGSQPNCQCTTPSSPANGNVLSDGVTATYTCSLNYTLNGDSTRTCGADGSGWSGSDPTCVACSSISTVTGGTVTLSTSGTVTTARYTCDLGYSLDGSSTITCLSSGSWDFTEPQCAECPILTDPASGTVTISTSGTSTSATYACASGYNLNGFTIRLCDSNGDWSLTEPTCTCQSPPQITNGLMITDGQTATYTCILRYSLNGVRTRTCNTDGSGWTDSDPTCEMCESLHAPNGGTIDFSTDNYNTVATFTCGTGYTLNGTTPITCQSDGTWESNQPICANCPDLSNPSSGSVSLSILNDVTTVATFTCASGYYLSGDFQLTCQSDATWSSTDPMCKCNFPTTPSNGVVSVSDGSSGILATYTCSEGYTLSGLSTRQCLTDGTGWEGSDPTCEVCQAVGIVTFGSFTLTSNNTHTRVTFRCNVGTTINGESEGACLEDGTWDNPEPTCVSCPDLSNPDSGTVSLSTTGLVTTATYTCASGYSLTSDGTLLCQTDGTWDNSPPTCVCTAAPVLQNGQVNTSSDFSEATYSCDTGYVLVGSSVRYCQNDGTGWNGTQPTCEECPTLQNPTGGFITLISDGETTTANYLCSSGYTLSGESFLTCQKDQTWDAAIPTCVQCKSLGTPLSTIVSTKTDGHVTTVSFSCVAGYTLVGPDSSTCFSNGSWNSSTPDCKCNNPPVVQNGAVIADGQTASYTCSQGFTLSGSQYRTCLTDGTGWSDTDPSCVQCAILANPVGGSFTLSTSGTMTSASFKCESGYSLSGHSTISCQSNGTWEAIPNCTECQEIDIPSNADLSITTTGTVSMVTYTCAPGYEMNGVSTRTCFSDGVWNGSTPTCSCQDPSQPTNGQVFADGHTATYLCSTGYTLDGPSVRTCASDGTGWNGTDPFCIKCADLSTIEGGKFELTTNGLQSTVSYTCYVGYTLNGTNSMTCFNTGSWNDTEPECVLCPTLSDPDSGSVTITTDGYTSSATFMCASGYYVNGLSTFDCLTSGQWAESSPACKCNLPSQPADGVVSVSDTVHGQMANYTCNTGYTLFGLSSRLCLSDGTGWEGDDPTCTSCILSTTPPEMSAELSTNGIVTIITYRCTLNYTLSGTSVQICQSDGTWSDIIPSCILCPTVISPGGGSVSIATDGLVTSISYTCNVGYTLSGAAELSCTINGNLNGSMPSCVLCPALSQPDSGGVSLSTDGYVTMATFTCQTGYYLSGQSSFTCLSSGVWNGDPPTCECNFPLSPANGAVSVKDTTDDTVAEYTCMTNYTLSGSSTRVCQNDGSGWTGTEPSCVSCNLTSTPSDSTAAFSSNGTVSMVMYTCALGFTLSGTPIQTCQPDGTWSDTLPICAACPTLSDPSSGTVALSTNGYITTATFTCVSGYYLSGQSSISCQTNGLWNGNPPTCECNFPASPSNGDVSVKDTISGTVAEYTCNTNYSLSGSPSRVCQDDGTGWTGTEPICVQCSMIDAEIPLGVTITTSGTVTSLAYSCSVNYTLVGISLQTCSSNGTWTSTPPICEPCNPKSSLESGSISFSSNGSVTQASFMCVQGYSLNSSSSAICLPDGTWDRADPVCICDPPVAPSNGDITVSSDGRYANYSCAKEYMLVGTIERFCLNNGTGWNGTDPTCELIAAVSGASTEDSSTFPLHIGLFIFLMIALVVLIGLVGFCAYRRFKAERPPSKIGATYDKNKVISTPEREKSFGTDKISKDMEEGKTFLISKPSDKKQTFDVRNLTPTPPNEVPNVKFDSDRPTQIVIRNGIASKPPELPPRSAKSNVNVPLSSVRLPKLKSQPPQRHDQPRPKKRRKKKPPAQENLISGSSESSTPIDIVIDPGNTPDISSTDLDYIQPVHLRNVPIPESGRPSTSSTLKSRPNTSVNRKKQVSGQNGKIGEN